MPNDPLSSDLPTTSRREFFRRGAQTAAVVGAATIAPTAATAASARGAKTGKRIPIAEIKIDADKVNDLAAGIEDRIYVAADNTVFIFHADGRPHAQTRFASPVTAITVKKDGTAIVATRESVSLLGDKGQFIAIHDIEGTPSIVSLSTHANGAIFAADSGNKAIWKFAPDNTLSGKIETGIAPLDDFFPMAIDAAGNLNVADSHRHCVVKFAPSGERLGKWGNKSRDLSGFGGCCNPVAIAVTSKGSFVTAEAGLPRIKVFSADGSFRELVAGPEEFETNARESREHPEKPATCHDGGFELAVDSKDRILVLDRVGKKVRVFA